jgi:hypothetical protein
MNRKLNIHKTSDFNIIDSTLLPVKYAMHITQEDYINNKVTIRDKQPICGVKGLCLMNSKKQFYYASVLDINMSDANILKNSAFYAPLMSGYLLADRGFSNKTVSNRINAIPGVTLVSPYHYKSVQKNGTYINPLHEDIYKKRWWIETGFMLLKGKRGQCKLDLSGKFTKPVLTAKFLASIMIYNYNKR